MATIVEDFEAMEVAEEPTGPIASAAKTLAWAFGGKCGKGAWHSDGIVFTIHRSPDPDQRSLPL